jgi:hypothetical protein
MLKIRKEKLPWITVNIIILRGILVLFKLILAEKLLEEYKTEMLLVFEKFKK